MRGDSVNEIVYYCDKDKYPVVEFIKTLSDKDAAKILREIDLLETHGFYLGMPHIKKMAGTKDLWELRVKQSSNNYRVFYFHYTNNQFVLLHAIHKKSKRTPKSDIKIATDRMNKYIKKGGQSHES
jgi:phage-related protein